MNSNECIPTDTAQIDSLEHMEPSHQCCACCVYVCALRFQMRHLNLKGHFKNSSCSKRQCFDANCHLTMHSFGLLHVFLYAVV